MPDLRTEKYNHAPSAQPYTFSLPTRPRPPIEELYVRKAGEEITDQLYCFEDKGGRRVALRPELTPSLARLALQRGKALVLPAKWFSIGQCWRYERATRGRRREHYQWNMDIIGVPGEWAGMVVCLSGCEQGPWLRRTGAGGRTRAAPPHVTATCTAARPTCAGVEAEAELLAAIVSFFQRLGLGPADVGLKVSSRKVLQVSTQAAAAA